MLRLTLFMWIKISHLLLGVIVTIILYRQIIPLTLLIRDFPLNDFSVYIDATKTALKGENPYQKWFFDRFNYPPITMAFFYPLTLISTNQAEFLFTGLSIISFLMGMWLIKKILDINVPRIVWLLILVLSIKTFPVKLTLSLGQINLIIMFLVILSFYLASRGKKSWAGICLGVASVVKLTPLPLALYFLWRKNMVTVREWGITMILLNLTGLIIWGWGLTKYYYFNLMPSLFSEVTEKTINTTYMNQSITAWLAKLGIFGSVNSSIRQLMSLIGLIVLIIGFKKIKKARSEFTIFWLTAVIAILFYPVFVWQHHYVFLLPLWLILVAQALHKRNAANWLFVIIGYGLLNLHFPMISSHFLITGVLFWMTVILIRFRAEKN